MPFQNSGHPSKDLRASRILMRTPSSHHKLTINTAMSSKLRYLALIASRQGSKFAPLSRHLPAVATAITGRSESITNLSQRLFSSNTPAKHDIEDESDIIELAKEEECDMERGNDVDTHLRPRRDDMGFDIEDEADLEEAAKEEAQDLAKGTETRRKIHPHKIVLDVEDESDEIESAKVKKEQPGRHREPVSVNERQDGIDHDIEDESDIIELAKDEVEEMEKRAG